MKKVDLYVDHDKLQRGGSQSAVEDTEGVSPGELIAVAGKAGLLRFHLKTVLQAAGLLVGLPWGNETAARDADLLEGFAARAIKVTKAREALSGPLMEKAQKRVQIIKNERTKKEALLLSEELLEEILEGQANEMASEIARFKDKLRENDEAQLAARSRQSFLDMRKSMETIKAEVPIVEGSKAAADIPL